MNECIICDQPSAVRINAWDFCDRHADEFEDWKRGEREAGRELNRARAYAWIQRQQADAGRSAELRALREKCGLTQAAFAEAIGITANVLARQERGEEGIGEPVLRLARIIAGGKS